MSPRVTSACIEAPGAGLHSGDMSATSLRFVLPLLFTILVVTPRSTHAAVTLWTGVTVRVYDATGASAGDRQPSLDIAASIMAAASIAVDWTVCDQARTVAERAHATTSDPGMCASPMTRGDLVVRIVRSSGADPHQSVLPLGDALIDPHTGSGVLATIYADRVEWVAAQSRVDRRVLLGRAIAHELGHLLLATNGHGTGGLMRAVWLPSELRRARTTDWTFGPGEIATISARRRAR